MYFSYIYIYINIYKCYIYVCIYANTVQKVGKSLINE